MRPRSWAVVWGQPPSSKAWRAAATAVLISDWLASGISAMTSSVEGAYTGMRLPEEPSVHSPLINIGSQLVCETAIVAPFESLARGNFAGCTRGHTQLCWQPKLLN